MPLPSLLARAALGLGLFAALTVASGCAPGNDVTDNDSEEVTDVGEDELTEPGFDRNRLVSDDAFTDWQALDASEIQSFLDDTPYGNKSRLATYSSGGMTAAQAIATASAKYHINPLVILVRAQMEQSLIAKTQPSQKALDYAFGCGCPDGSACSTQWKGFHKQADCMASHMRSYLDDQDDGGETIAGWKVGRAKKTLDPQWVTPKNRATAALYTYTPWVGSSGFGNLAHYKIWKNFAGYVGYAPVGPGGCPAMSYPAGLVAESRPAPELTEAYTTELGPFGLDAASAPTCFLDPQNLVDPSSGAIAPSTSKISDNFRFSELMVGEPSSRQALVDPDFVKKLQTLRAKLGTPVTVVDAFQSPERHVAECTDACGGQSSCLAGCAQTLPLALGRAAIITSSGSTSTILDRAAAAGFTTCWSDGTEVYVATGAPALGCPAN